MRKENSKKGTLRKHLSSLKRVDLPHTDLQFYQRLFGKESDEYAAMFDSFMEFVAEKGLALIQAQQVEPAYKLLKKAEGFTVLGLHTSSPRHRVIILNHLSCCMRRFGKQKLALSHLKSALKLGESGGVGDMLARTCLNLCVVYRELEDHRRALEFAKRACAELSHLVIKTEPSDFMSNAEYERFYKEKVGHLAMSYHNLSLEYEHFENAEMSLEAAKKAFQLMNSKFGPRNKHTITFKQNYYNKLNADPPELKTHFTLGNFLMRTNTKTASKVKGNEQLGSLSNNSSQDGSNLLGLSKSDAASVAQGQYTHVKVVNPDQPVHQVNRQGSSGKVRALPEWKVKQRPYSGAEKKNHFHVKCAPVIPRLKNSVSYITGNNLNSTTSIRDNYRLKSKPLIAAHGISHTRSSSNFKKSILRSKSPKTPAGPLTPKLNGVVHTPNDSLMSEQETGPYLAAKGSPISFPAQNGFETPEGLEKKALIRRNLQRFMQEIDSLNRDPTSVRREQNARRSLERINARERDLMRSSKEEPILAPAEPKAEQVVKPSSPAVPQAKLVAIRKNNAAWIILRFLRTRVLSSKHFTCNSDDFLFVFSKSSKILSLPDTTHTLVMVEKKQKKMIVLSFRYHPNYKREHTLRWETKELENCKGEAEIRFRALQISKKLIKENLRYSASHGFEWIKTQENEARRVVIQTKAVQRIQSCLRRFFAKKHVDSIRSNTVYRLVDHRIVSNAGNKYYLCASAFDTIGEELLVECINLTNVKRLPSLRIKSSTYDHTRVAIDSKLNQFEYLPLPTPVLPPIVSEVAAQQEDSFFDAPAEPALEQSQLSAASATSLVSRRSALFGEDHYVISAHQNVQANKVEYRLMKKSDKALQDQLELDATDALSPSDFFTSNMSKDLATLARSELRNVYIEKDPNSAKVCLVHKKEGANLLAQIGKAIPDIIRVQGKVLYYKPLGGGYSFEFLASAYQTLLLYLFKTDEQNPKEHNWLDFVETHQPVGAGLTADDYEKILLGYRWDRESDIIVDLTHKDSSSSSKESSQGASEEQHVPQKPGLLEPGQNHPELPTIIIPQGVQQAQELYESQEVEQQGTTSRESQDVIFTPKPADPSNSLNKKPIHRLTFENSGFSFEIFVESSLTDDEPAFVLRAQYKPNIKAKKPAQTVQLIRILCSDLKMRIRKPQLKFAGSRQASAQDSELLLAYSISRKPNDGSLEPQAAEKLFLKKMLSSVIANIKADNDGYLSYIPAKDASWTLSRSPSGFSNSDNFEIEFISEMNQEAVDDKKDGYLKGKEMPQIGTRSNPGDGLSGLEGSITDSEHSETDTKKDNTTDRKIRIPAKDELIAVTDHNQVETPTLKSAVEDGWGVLSGMVPGFVPLINFDTLVPPSSDGPAEQNPVILNLPDEDKNNILKMFGGAKPEVSEVPTPAPELASKLGYNSAGQSETPTIPIAEIIHKKVTDIFSFEQLMTKMKKSKSSWMEIFYQIDRTNSNLISTMEAFSFFSREMGLTRQLSLSIVKKVDFDRDGFATLAEWMKFESKLPKDIQVNTTYKGDDFEKKLLQTIKDKQMSWLQLFEQSKRKSSVNYAPTCVILKTLIDILAISKGHAKELLQKIDKDGDGYITEQEWTNYFESQSILDQGLKMLVQNTGTQSTDQASKTRTLGTSLIANLMQKSTGAIFADEEVDSQSRNQVLQGLQILANQGLANPSQNLAAKIEQELTMFQIPMPDGDYELLVESDLGLKTSLSANMAVIQMIKRETMESPEEFARAIDNQLPKSVKVTSGLLELETMPKSQKRPSRDEDELIQHDLDEF